jgi:hypothetical protein
MSAIAFDNSAITKKIIDFAQTNSIRDVATGAAKVPAADTKASESFRNTADAFAALKSEAPRYAVAVSGTNPFERLKAAATMKFLSFVMPNVGESSAFWSKVDASIASKNANTSGAYQRACAVADRIARRDFHAEATALVTDLGVADKLTKAQISEIADALKTDAETQAGDMKKLAAGDMNMGQYLAMLSNELKRGADAFVRLRAEFAGA